MKIAPLVATTATGLLAGTFFYGYLNVVPTFNEVSLDVHLRFRVQLMAHNGVVVQLLMSVAILSTSWYAFTVRHHPKLKFLLPGAALLVLTSLLVTRFGNVPINQQIKYWSPVHPPADYRILLQRWNVFNTLRTVTAIAAFLLVVYANTLLMAPKTRVV